jgi:chaperonin GroEL
VSANGDSAVGRIIADCMEKVGNDGIITVEEGAALETTFEVTQGTVVAKGSLSPYFINDDERQVAELDEPLILLHEKGISRMQDIVPVMEMAVEAGRPLLVIAEITGDALATLVVNKVQGKLKACAIKPPSFGDRRRDLIKDLAAQTGGRAITDDLGFGIDQVRLEDLGRAKRVIVDKEKTTIIGGESRKPEIEGRARQIRAMMEATNSVFDKQQLTERLAKLMGNAGVIKVGGATKAEINEKSARVDDALYATRAAVEEGVVPGGGVALLRALSALSHGDQGLSVAAAAGVSIVRRACEEPCRQILRNAGKHPAAILSRIKEANGAFGYNAAADRFEDLIDAGVIDPAKVVRLALQNAASIATLLVMSEIFVVDAPRTPVDYPVQGGTAQDALGIDPFLSRR